MSDQLKTVPAMNKLYIGNLPIEADEAAVRQLFMEQNLTVADISVKRGGYAFVDFPDQSAADRAIDKLHDGNLSSGNCGPPVKKSFAYDSLGSAFGYVFAFYILSVFVK